MDELTRSLWTFLSLLLVFLMIPGAGLIGSGCVRQKNALSQLSGTFLLFIHGFLLFGLIGNGIVFGKEFLFFQNLDGFLPNGIHLAVFSTFHGLFFCLALVILQGSWAERARLVPLLIFGLLWGVLVYFPIAFLIWGKGSPLSSYKIIDFAGGIVVHVTTGFTALAMTIRGGRRKDYFNLTFKSNNTSLFLGTVLLGMGWIGFNGGSSLVLNKSGIFAGINTIISGAAAVLVWFWLDLLHTPHKSTMKGMALGLVCGLVGITPGSGFLLPQNALILGIFSGALGNFSVRWMNQVFKQDDFLEVFSTHGICGIAGSLFCLIFLPEGSFSFAAQFLIVLGVAVYSFLVATILLYFWGPKQIFASEADQEIGLDQFEHGESILNGEN